MGAGFPNIKAAADTMAWREAQQARRQALIDQAVRNVGVPSDAVIEHWDDPLLLPGLVCGYVKNIRTEFRRLEAENV